MPEFSPHIQTLQNLCVIAHADGTLKPEEISLLQELGAGMGITPEQIDALIAQIDQLEFCIPEDEADRLMELRMVVLMMFTDRQISPSEYDACLDLAKQMGINESYLEEIISFYRQKQQDHQRHLGIFQNLFLVAVANGYISEDEQRLLLEVAHNLGLGQEDIDYLLNHHTDLDFVIPDDPGERLFSLKNLVYMMIVDGQIDAEEYELCREFANRIGYSYKDVDLIIEEYRQMQREREASQNDIERHNIDVYLDVYQDFEQLSFPSRILADHLLQVVQTSLCTPLPRANAQENLRFYRFLWLMYVRCTTISPEAALLLPAYLDLAREQGNFKQLRDFLLQNEQTFGGSLISLPQLDLRIIQLEIQAQLEQWHRSLPPETLRQLITLDSPPYPSSFFSK